jgi:pilus assembly protein CpaD
MSSHRQRSAVHLGLRNPGAFVRAALLMTVALSCAGCMATADHEYVGSVPVDYRLRHPITIQESNRTLEVFVGQRRDTLMPSQRSEVAAFVNDWRNEATGGIVIDTPVGKPNARAAASVARELREVLTRAGAPARAIAIRHYRPTEPSMLATVKLSYPRMAANAGPCGLWPHDLGPTVDSEHNQNRPYWNEGCATQHNLAAMVANPADLVQPRAETQIYAARRATVLDKYRKGESTEAVNPNADKGKVSDVGK